MNLARVLLAALCLALSSSCVGDDDGGGGGGGTCYYLAEWQECHCEPGPGGNGTLCEFCYPCWPCPRRQGSSCIHGGGEVSPCLSECPAD